MAAFVDDVRDSFDASDFCATVSAGVGVGKTTSGLALRDSSSVSAASSALQSFLHHATTPGPPDVVASYVQYSPGANELFTTLRAVSTNVPLASLALDCLTAMVRYSLDNANPIAALEGARSVVKEVVKTRAVLVKDVFIHDQRGAAKKALNLLRLVAQCHPILAKEVVNRFNLAADPMAPSLCSKGNNYCRVPFLDLLFVLLACGDFDVANCLSTSARPVLITCLRVITERTIEESNPNRSSFISVKEKAKGKKAGKSGSIPSYVQKIELIAAINLLLAFERHLLALPQVTLRRFALAYPMMELLASIAAAEVPPLDVAPSEVRPEHEVLRETASRLFVAIAGDSKVSRMPEVIAALTHTSVADGTGAVSFILNVIEEQPRVAKGLLEKGTYLSEQPRLSSSWFGQAAVISACVLRLPCAISKFADRQFFAQCLSHEDSLIRHTGITIMHAFCKVVQADKAAACEPEKFLPPLNHVRVQLKQYQTSYRGAQKLLTAYQKLFCDDIEGAKADPIKLSVEMAGQDLVLSEDSIRAALAATPRDALYSIFRKRYLAKLILRAAGTKDKTASKRLWYLSRDVLVLTGLFPHGTETEIDIYLSFLSGSGEDFPECANALEKAIFEAWKIPYRLSDELHRNAAHASERLNRTSLLSVAIVFRLRKLKALHDDGKKSREQGKFQRVLQRILATVLACQRLSGSGYDGRFLKDGLLGMAFFPDESGLAPCAELSNEQRLMMDCRIAQRLFSRTLNYPRTPYLKLIQAILLFHLRVLRGSTSNTVNKSAAADIGFVWRAWRTFRATGDCTRNVDPFGGVYENVTSKPVLAGMALGGFLDGLRDFRSKSEISRYVLLLRTSLNANDFILSIAIALRMVQNQMVRSFMLSTVLDALSSFLPADEESTALVPFVQESLLAAVGCKQTWNEGQVHAFVSFSLHTLKSHESLTANEGYISFAFALLTRLVVHEDEGTRILSRTLLLTESEAEFPPLLSIPRSSADDLSILLKHYPRLLKAVVTRVSHCNISEFTTSVRKLLPLLQVVMGQDLFVDEKKAVGYEHEKVCKTVLEAFVSSEEYLFDHHLDGALQIQEAARQIGEVIVFSGSTFDDVFAVLGQAKEEGDEITMGNLWMLLGNVFSEERQQELTKMLTDLRVVECLTILTEWLVQKQVNLDDAVHQSALAVLYGVLKYLRARNVAIYSVVKDATALEKMLTAACSNVMKSLHGSMGCCREPIQAGCASGTGDRDMNAHSVPISLPFLCITEVLRLDLVLDKAAKRSLISLSDHDGGFLAAIFQRGHRAYYSHVTIQNATPYAVATFVQAALTRLPRFGLEEEVAKSLSITERILSAEKSVFNASLSESDIAIRECMHGIKVCLRVNDGQKKFCLPDRRTGFFEAISSHVISLFDKKRLEYTCHKILEPSVMNSGKWFSSPSSPEDALDPIFVLRVFLSACAEAQKAPGSAILDIGRIAKDGVLAVALTGLASDDDEIRALSFACMHYFSGVVGPVSGVPLGSAAALYKDRKQLAFLLDLLQNSVHTAMMKVLPLFAVWFRTALKVALSPAHDANKAVTFFFLHSPSMDLSDCLGLSRLLHCDSSGPEMEATRLLALDIIKHGVRSMKDVNVLRKRRIFDWLLMLGGSASGNEQRFRDEVLNTFVAILSRNSEVLIAHDMVFSFGIVPWLLHDASQVEEPDHVLRRRLDVLLHIASSFIEHHERERVAVMLSEALSVLTRTFLRRPDSVRSTNVMSSIMNCSAAIAFLAPQRRGLILLDFSKIYLRHRDYCGPESIDGSLVASIVARQKNVEVHHEIYSFLLETTLSDVASSGSACASRAVLAHPNGVNISMVHAFIAQSLLRRRRMDSSKEELTSGFCLRLANAMYACPTVWLTIASLCTLELKGSLSSGLVLDTDQLPARPPHVIDAVQEQRYCAVVDGIRQRIIENLISCSFSKEKTSQDGIYASTNGVR